MKITEENFDSTYLDSIEIERIDKFVCDEMDRQIHRYIKAMHGTKEVMERFIGHLKTLDIAGKEQMQVISPPYCFINWSRTIGVSGWPMFSHRY